MADQDPHPDSVAGDLGHGTMSMAVEAEPAIDNDELVGAVGGTDADISTGYGSVKWNDEDLLIEINIFIAMECGFDWEHALTK